MYLGHVLSCERNFVGRCTCSAKKKILTLWMTAKKVPQEQICNSQSCNTISWAWFWPCVCAWLFLVCDPLGLSDTDFWTCLGLFLFIHYSSFSDWRSSVTFHTRCKEYSFFILEFIAITWVPSLFTLGLLFVYILDKIYVTGLLSCWVTLQSPYLELCSVTFLVWMFDDWIIHHL
jgi:hypothetical protein